MFWMILFSLFLTTAIEGIIYAVSNRFDLKTYVIMLVTNIVLNPTMNIFITSIKSYNGYLTALIIWEVFTIAIESLIYFFVTKKKYPFSLLIAFSANIASFAIGNAINKLNIVSNEKAYLVGSIIFIFFTILELLLFLVLFIYRNRGYNRGGSSGGSRFSGNTQSHDNNDHNGDC